MYICMCVMLITNIFKKTSEKLVGTIKNLQFLTLPKKIYFSARKKGTTNLKKKNKQSSENVRKKF